MSIIAAAIAFRKEMKLSIGTRCQATANESGVKPPQSKITHGCNLQTDASEVMASAHRQTVFCLAINLIIGVSIPSWSASGSHFCRRVWLRRPFRDPAQIGLVILEDLFVVACLDL